MALALALMAAISAAPAALAPQGTRLADAPSSTAPSIAPPMAQEAANCLRPVYATDQLVCADPALRALDAETVALLGRVGQRGPMSAGAWIEDQQTWFRRRSLCAFRTDHIACVQAAYRTRNVELAALASALPESGVTMRCSQWRAVRIVPGDLGARIVVNADGGIRAIAFPETLTAWTAYVTYRSQGRTLWLNPLHGAEAIRCR